MSGVFTCPDCGEVADDIGHPTNHCPAPRREAAPSEALPELEAAFVFLGWGVADWTPPDTPPVVVHPPALTGHEPADEPPRAWDDPAAIDALRRAEGPPS